MKKKFSVRRSYHNKSLRPETFIFTVKYLHGLYRRISDLSDTFYFWLSETTVRKTKDMLVLSEAKCRPVALVYDAIRLVWIFVRIPLTVEWSKTAIFTTFERSSEPLSYRDKTILR